MSELFPGFLDDAELYGRVEAYWASLVSRALSDVESVHPWLVTRFANGVRFAQGDPIYSAYVPAIGRAVQIDQTPAKAGSHELNAGFKMFGDEPKVTVLQIECTLTAETGSAVVGLINDWLVENKSKAVVQQRAQTFAAALRRAWRPQAPKKNVQIASSDLDFALTHLLRRGGSSFFPRAFEFSAMKSTWESLRRTIGRVDLARHVQRGRRSYLAPRKAFGLREASELSPIDSVLYTALAREIGDRVERVRVPTECGVVHSFRFCADDAGELWDRDWSFKSFEDATKKQLQAQSGYVAVTDITDFYHQLRPDSLRRRLRAVKERDDRSEAIVRFIFGGRERGLPVGPTASSLFAELALSDVDDYLLAHKLNYVRYNDDFRFFCADERDARRALELLANHLWQTHGLRLKGEKTSVQSAEQFVRDHFREKTPEQVDLDGFGEQLKVAVGGYDLVDFDSLSEVNQTQAMKAGKFLQSAVDKTHVAYFSRVGHVLRNLRVTGKPALFAPVIDEMERLVPVVKLVTRSLGRLAAASADDRTFIRERMLAVMGRAIATPTPPSDYELTWLSSLFTSPYWGDLAELSKIGERLPQDFVAQREVLLATRIPDAVKLDLNDPWHRRARVAVARRLGPSRGSELDRELDVAIMDWAQTHPHDFTNANDNLPRTNGQHPIGERRRHR